MHTMYKFSTTEGKSGTLLLNGSINEDELDYVKERVSHLISIGMLTTHTMVIEEAVEDIKELGYTVVPHTITEVNLND